MRPGNVLFKRGTIKLGACWAFPPWVVVQAAIHAAVLREARHAVAEPDGTRAVAQAAIHAAVQDEPRAAELAVTHAAVPDAIPEPGAVRFASARVATHVVVPGAIPELDEYQGEDSPSAVQVRDAIPFSAARQDVIRCEVAASAAILSAVGEPDAIHCVAALQEQVSTQVGSA
ncbi:MAG TPA: hypothetical protein VGF82_20790 [Terracidiphilus sp.]|jgi:hypothetical protein